MTEPEAPEGERRAPPPAQGRGAEERRRTRYRRWAAFGGLLAVALAATAIAVASRTGFGQERLRGATVDWLTSRFPGRITIGSLTSESSLLGTMTLRDVSIADPGGRPFLDVDVAVISYDWRTLVSGRVVLDDVEIDGARVIIERLPGWEEWNYERAFRGDPSDPADTTRTLVDLYDVSVSDATVVVRMPWESDGADSARVLIEQTPEGPVRAFSFQNLSLRAPRVLAETPREPGRLIEVADLAADVYVWDEPARVRAARGTVTVRDSIVTLDLDRVDLPGSRLSVIGRVVLGDGGLRPDVRVRGERLDLADLGWLHPSLPPEGSGTGSIDIRSIGPSRYAWFGEDLDVRTPDTHVEGTLGLVTGDTLYFSRLDLAADPFDLETLERLLPVDLPLDGLEASTLRIDDGR
ncbi:MAG TPA: hypothetical protein VK837_04235 [Longimicrobiales bacterium]|nr:hypothetical protein [Longimicrobiales bacterium]